ncbi:uncharacterized protein LOC102679242 [Apis dorsata]|uniref:uncharacterized protein LOC102679242 n=1 Tax=Apis dorsata TaxID=7462 RepID=UPI0003DF6C6E|nr:uncharacterized protein LOC102679242 [Apis dorsata]
MLIKNTGKVSSPTRNGKYTTKDIYHYRRKTVCYYLVAPSYQPVESRRRFDTDELFTKRLQRHNHRESNDHTMARRTSLQAILKPPTRHTHNKPRRIRHIRCKILLEGRKTIK